MADVKSICHFCFQDEWRVKYALGLVAEPYPPSPVNEKGGPTLGDIALFEERRERAFFIEGICHRWARFKQFLY
jgi:hypothetical protein